MPSTPHHISFCSASIGMEEYIHRFRDAERIEGYCRECHNYGQRWGCPPFDYSVENELLRYREVLLVAARITPEQPHLPLAEGMLCLLPARLRLETIVRELETTLDGRAMGLAGQCTYCGAQPDPQLSVAPCAKQLGLPCRHPELVRPALEAWGFDITKTAEELLHMPILWSTDGLTPDYFTLVCAFFHNADPAVAEAALQQVITNQPF